MSIFRKQQAERAAFETAAQQLYKVVSSATGSGSIFEREKLGENMEVVNMLFIDYWKPRYLLNHNTKRAYEFMNEQAHLVGVSDADIVWSSLEGIPEEQLYRVQTRNALFPSFIGHYANGTAQVQWQINPDGRYWMDEDGYGMTPDIQLNLYGYIDSACKVIVPFQVLQTPDQLQEMRARAEHIVATRGRW